MISKLYFEETFSIGTAQALQAWADNNLIIQGLGDYAMRIGYLAGGEMFAETEITGLTIGDEYILSTETIEINSNQPRTKINSLPNDNTSMVEELGYGTGKRTLLFTATAETMYIAIGDETGASTAYQIVDNVSLKIDGVEAVTNGTFEGNNTTGWYAQNGNSTLSVYSYAVDPTLSNPYLETVNIPVYDVGNSTHCLIGTDAVWSEATLGDAQWQHYFVPAGDYTGRPLVTRSGTASNRITVSPYGQERHPGELLDGERAKIAIEFNGADYWTVSKMTSNNFHGSITTGGAFSFRNANYNILDQILQKDGSMFIRFDRNSHYNTVQKCFVDNPSITLQGQDLGYIFIKGFTNEYQITYNKIIANDFKNFKSVKIGAHPNDETNRCNIEGMISDSNNLWYTDDFYYDKDGTPNTSGLYGGGETNFGATKVGSDNANAPYIQSNNTMMGSKPQHDNVAPELSFNSPGFGLAYLHTENAHRFGNVIYNNCAGISNTSNSGGIETFDCRVEKNILVNVGNNPRAQYVESSSPLKMENGQGIIAKDNLIKNPHASWAVLRDGVGQDSTCYLGENTVINKVDEVINYAGNYPGYNPTDTNIYLDTAAGDIAYPYDYVVTQNRYTGTPTTVTVPNVLSIPQEDFIQSIWEMT